MENVRLAGGQGAVAATQYNEALLRRSVMANLLWEDQAYESGKSVAENIARLVPKVDPQTVSNIAYEARHRQKLRHTPIYLAVLMSMLDSHKGYVRGLLPRIIGRADNLSEVLAIYMKLNGGKPIPNQLKKAVAASFDQFNEYHFAKYKSGSSGITLRDAMFLTHPKPGTQERTELYAKIADDTLEPADTWEVNLSAGKNKKETWSRLIVDQKLGALAFLRNLRNMEQAGVDDLTIDYGFKHLNTKWLLPLNYYAAASENPKWRDAIEVLMLKSYEQAPKLPGLTHFFVDESGSMSSRISGKSKYSRFTVSRIMAMMAVEVCERVMIFATAGSDMGGTHKTVQVPTVRGFDLINKIESRRREIGGGGIFTAQCLNWAQENYGTADRVIVFSDSQDCDRKGTPLHTYGKTNYIVDVSAHLRGINYPRKWTAEVSGWSEHFLTYIMALEGLEVAADE